MDRRAPRGLTYDPCHACFQTKLRPKNEICNDCRRELNFAQQRAKELQTLGDQAKKPFYCKERDYALPMIYRAPRELVQKTFFELGQLVSEPTNETPPLLPPDKDHSYSHEDPRWHVWQFDKNEYRTSDWKIVRAFVPSVAVALGNAYRAVQAATEYAYRDGHDDGRRLLMQLASGEITADKFNEAAVRVQGE